MSRQGRRDIDMTRGPLLGKMLVFILPLMITNLLQVCYNAADMMIVGLSPEADAVGAIGTTGAFTALVMNLLAGISVGANVVVARHIGARQREEARAAVHTATLLGLGIGIIGAAAGFAVTPFAMETLGNTGRLLELSILYARVYFIALPFHALSNFAISIHRAKGDTRTPLIVLTATGLLNVALNLFFVLVLRMSVEGVAIATGIAAAVSAAVLYANLARDSGPCHFSLRHLRLNVQQSKTILAIGLPAGVQSVLFAVSNLLIQSSVLQINNALTPVDAPYAPVVRANSAVANIANFAFTAMNAASMATVSFTGQNLGAKQYARIRRVTGVSYALLIAVAAAVSAILLLLRDPLIALYGILPSADPTDALAYEAALIRAHTIWPFFFVSAFMETGSSTLRGLGKSFIATIVCLIGTCALRIVWIYTVFRYLFTLESLYISYAISWAITGIALLACVLALYRRLPREDIPSKAPI